MHLRDKLSLHEIARRTGLSRNTVRNWLRAPEEVREPTYSRKKDRRTACALFAQIKASGYAGGYTRVTGRSKSKCCHLASSSSRLRAPDNKSNGTM